LVLRSDEMLASIPAFLEKCLILHICVLDIPTAFWHQLTSELSTSGLTLPESLRLVIIGGEKALPDKVFTWQQKVETRVRLVNSYGPTETTVVATICDLAGTKKLAAVEHSVPIGGAIANTQTYVLDAHLQPVPIGVWGELYIGGSGVGRGYLHQPQLTAQKFIPNPFSNELGSRLYKTGDLVRYRSDGLIEFNSRVDNQVKVRGLPH
jgi:non-ribosomal peptide synthetase component F